MTVPDRRFLKPVVEYIILTAAGLMAVIEGLRLEGLYRPKGVYDRIGAGNYLLGIGVALLVVGAAYFYAEIKRCRCQAAGTCPPAPEKAQGGTMALVVTVGLTALNILLIPILGYLVPAVLFFVLNFTIFRLTRWPLLNVAIGVLVGLGFFLLFTHALGMFFPAGRFGLDFSIK